MNFNVNVTEVTSIISVPLVCICDKNRQTASLISNQLNITVIYDIMGLCLNRLFYHDVNGLVASGLHTFPKYEATVNTFPVSQIDFHYFR